MRIKNRIQRHPIATYLVLTMVWSFGFWSCLFFFIEPGGLLNGAPPISFLFVILGGFGPSLSGLAATWLVYGRDGLRSLWARVRFSGVGRWWWSILVIPAVTALTPLARMVAGYAVDVDAMVGLIGPGLALGLTAGLMEEVGWRGFLLPHLRARLAPIPATLVLGLVWGGVWHGYADYFALGGRGLETVALILLLGPLLLTAWSFIITAVYERTGGNLLVSFLLHAGISSSALIFGQKYTTATEELTWTLISTLFAIAAAGAFFAATRGSVQGTVAPNRKMY